jgi:hypothetical protein
MNTTAPSSALSFPESLLRPTPSQAELAAQEVNVTILELEAWFRSRAARLGVPFRDFALQAEPKAPPEMNPALVAVLGMMLPKDLVSLDRVSGEWGLTYRRAEWPQPPKPPVPLRDAPLAVRKQFLIRSKDFARAYLAAAEAALADPREAVRAGKETLLALENITPR